MRVKHNLALLNLTVFLEQASDLNLRKARVNASNEQVGAGIDGAVILRRWAAIVLWATMTRQQLQQRMYRV